MLVCSIFVALDQEKNFLLRYKKRTECDENFRQDT